jgi:UPF0271 protein
MAKIKRIDLNSDVGESFGNHRVGLDPEVIPLISSANVACGYHGGDPHVMKQTLALAKKHGVAVGGHPGFPDLMGFGRRNMDVTLEEIQDYVTYQVGALQAFASVQGLRLQHVKLHGALYNMAVQDPKITEAVAAVLNRLDPRLILLVLAGPDRTQLEELGKRNGLRMAYEFFADRAYNRDGTLVSRREPGAVLHDEQQVTEKVLQMVDDQSVTARDGSKIPLAADTICVHGDNPAAVSLARRIRQSLQDSGVEVVPFGTFL